MAGGQREERTGTWANEMATARFAARVAAAVQPGDVLALVGDLGSGKTTLARYLAAALGVAVDGQFSSPTYCYANEYAGRLPVIHMDLYRVDDQATAHQLSNKTYAQRRLTIVQRMRTFVGSPQGTYCR